MYIISGSIPSVTHSILISNFALGAWPACWLAKYMARQGRTTSVLQQTSCFHQFLSRCSTGSLETCTRNSVAKMYCPTSDITPKFQRKQSIPMQLVLLTKSNNGNTYIYINNLAICKALLSLTNCLLNFNTKTQLQYQNFNKQQTG